MFTDTNEVFFSSAVVLAVDLILNTRVWLEIPINSNLHYILDCHNH